MSRQAERNGNPTEIQVPITKQVLFQSVVVSVLSLPDGGRQLQLVDPATGTVYLVPMTPDVARQIGSDLMSALHTAGPDEMPGG